PLPITSLGTFPTYCHCLLANPPAPDYSFHHCPTRYTPRTCRYVLLQNARILVPRAPTACPCTVHSVPHTAFCGWGWFVRWSCYPPNNPRLRHDYSNGC